MAPPKSTSDDKPKASKPLVVLDPGHGGRDSGAKGHQGLLEKDLTLKIALNLERELRKHGLDVLLTRRDDTYVSLEDRTALANQKNNGTLRLNSPQCLTQLRVHQGSRRIFSIQPTTSILFGWRYRE